MQSIHFQYTFYLSKFNTLNIRIVLYKPVCSYLICILHLFKRGVSNFAAKLGLAAFRFVNAVEWRI